MFLEETFRRKVLRLSVSFQLKSPPASSTIALNKLVNRLTHYFIKDLKTLEQMQEFWG